MSAATRACAALLAVVSSLALPAQQRPAPAALPADWAQRDVEGKWVVYRAAVDAADKPDGVIAAWARALAEAQEHELLELIVIHDGWSHAGPELVRASAPQWVRAAVWNLANFDSHAQDGAQKVMRENAGVVLEWFAAYPSAVRGPLVEFRAKLEAANGGAWAGDVSPLLPPLDPMQVMVPWLDAPGVLQEFGTRTRAEPKVRYVHQVVRALGGVLVLGDAGDGVLTKVLALTRHAHPVVRHRAFDTLAKLPPQYVPFDALARLVNDAAAEPDRRRLATLAASSSSHPALLDLLVPIVLDAAHPATEIAATRFGEVGDPVAARALHTFAAKLDDHGRRLGAALAKVEQRRASNAFVQPPALRALLLRAVWLQRAADERAPGVLAATTELLRATPKHAVQGLVQLGQQPAPPSPMRDGSAAALEQALQQLAARLLAELNGEK